LLPVAAYGLGSIPVGLLLARKWAGVDVRRHGSGNIGATNVRRLAGNRLGLLTLGGDVLKGALPTLAALRHCTATGPWTDAYVATVIICCVLGHMFPVFLGFREGGKGVSTAAGGILVVSPWGLLILVAVFGAATALSRRVSVGSLSAAVLLPLVLGLGQNSLVWALGGGVLTLLVVMRHHGNIRRLLAGTEPPLQTLSRPSDPP
jgi:acyl phosphate:glycerol-3-phosphate acyltransferase